MLHYLFQTCTRCNIYVNIVLQCKENFISSLYQIEPIFKINYQQIYLESITNINILKKKPTKFKYKNTTPGEQNGEVIVYSVQQPLNLILYRSKLNLYSNKARGQFYVKAIKDEPV